MVKKLFVIALVGLTLSVWGSAAFGQSGLTDRGVKCFHVLHAYGKGYAHLEGEGTVKINGGACSLLVKNFSQTEVTVMGNGMKIPFPEKNAMLYIGYGQAEIKGEAVDIFLTLYPHPRGEIHARGKGKADLRGEWRYKVLKVCAAAEPILIEEGQITETDGERIVTYEE